jgi:hypothetical protein
MTTAEIGSDNRLVLGKLRLKLKCKQRIEMKHKFRINIESLQDEFIKDLFRRRLQLKLEQNRIIETDDVKASCSKVKENIIEAAKEALGQRRVNVNGESKTRRTPWFCEEIELLATENRNAYVEYRRVQANEAHENYKSVRNRINSSITKIKEQYWQKSSTEMENDFYGLQKQVWGLLRNQTKEVR